MYNQNPLRLTFVISERIVSQTPIFIYSCVKWGSLVTYLARRTRSESRWQKLGKRYQIAIKGATTHTLSTFIMANNYIVTLKENASDADVDALKNQIKSAGGEITQEYSLIKGFAAKLPEVAASLVEKNPQVLLFEPDQEVSIQ